MNEAKTQNEKTIGADLKAGLVVFLIALPLSLGISLASGAPSTAGLISAVLGGLLGAYLGGSYVTINGPAAGLIVVVLGAIQSLGDGDPASGFRRFLACVVVVGALQILSGILRAGRFAALFPLSVVHGMLASIGLIIMIKQAHVFLGHSGKGSVIKALVDLPGALLDPVPQSALIGLLSIVLLLLYPFIRLKIAKVIPAPLVVVGVGIGLATVLKPEAMVSIPTNLNEFIVTPQFDVITSWKSAIAIFSLFFVASLESILSASAVDQLDPLGRESNFDRELWSKGAVNLVCGLIGGLPIIAEIVRSSANITQGGRTPLANFSHGLLILVFILAVPGVLNLIPLSALAAILIIVGYRLANPRQFKDMWSLGPNSFFAFVTTIFVTVSSDLLMGVAAGLVTKFVLSLATGAKFTQLIRPAYKLQENGHNAILNFEGSLTFFSVLKQKEILAKVSRCREIQIDLTDVSFADATSLSFLSRELARIGKTGAVVNVKLPTRYEQIYKNVKGH